MRQVESSLRRLKTDRIDVYYAHRPDPVTPIDETLWAFNDLIHQGKILYYAVSKHTAWQVVNIMSTCDKLNLIPPICHQVPYSLADRSVESDVVTVYARYGIRLACYSPLAGGLLAGRSTAHRPIVGNLRWSKPPGFTQAQLAQADSFDALAREVGYEPSQLALAWLLSRPSVDTVVCGAETLSELECDLGSINIQLSEQDRWAAEQIFAG
jgi:aryl-alcohol dehydrogenase-like predicted oxidoreductase